MGAWRWKIGEMEVEDLGDGFLEVFLWHPVSYGRRFQFEDSPRRFVGFLFG
jgi:hypothetical protein